VAHDRRFRFGIQLARSPSGADWAATAQRAEELGYSTLLLPDHFGDQLAPIPAVMAAADATTDLRVGTLVLDNDYRHPVVVAKEAATIDLLSGGRLELGVGAGWMTSDYEQSGIPHDRPGVRIDRMVEGLQILKGLLEDEKPVSFTGEHYQVTDAVGTPRPAQRPRPPILIGGGGPRILSVAGREADIVGITASLTQGYIDPSLGKNVTAGATAEKIQWVKDAAGDRFDDIELNVQVILTMVTDDREATAKGLAENFQLSTEEALEVPQVLLGTVDEICDQLVARRDQFGFSYVIVNDSGFEALAPVIDRLAGT
jgi:probable F420-dependent oxidoreductase